MAWMRKLERLVWRWEFDGGEKFVEANRKARFANVLKYFRNHADWRIENSDIDLTDSEKRRMMSVLRSELEPRWPALRNLLLRIEQALNGGRPAWDIRANFTIEHVLPKDGGGADWAGAIKRPQEERRRLALQLGNLCFVTENRRLGDKSFAEKKALIGETDDADASRLTAAACAEAEWTEQVIKRRTEKYAMVFATAFDLEQH
jgi:hypothetical protein